MALISQLLHELYIIFDYFRINKNLSKSYLELSSKIYNYLSNSKHKYLFIVNLKYTYLIISLYREDRYYFAFIIINIE